MFNSFCRSCKMRRLPFVFSLPWILLILVLTAATLSTGMDDSEQDSSSDLDAVSWSPDSDHAAAPTLTIRIGHLHLPQTVPCRPFDHQPSRTAPCHRFRDQQLPYPRVHGQCWNPMGSLSATSFQVPARVLSFERASTGASVSARWFGAYPLRKTIRDPWIETEMDARRLSTGARGAQTTSIQDHRHSANDRLEW